MTRDPYRRSEQPADQPPRGKAVRRADSPDEIEREAGAHTQARYRAQTARIQTELEIGRHKAAIRSRAVGAGLLGVGMLLGWLTMNDLVSGRRVIFNFGGLVCAGAWLIAFGAGGAASLREAPSWVKAGTFACYVLGGVLFAAMRL